MLSISSRRRTGAGSDRDVLGRTGGHEHVSRHLCALANTRQTGRCRAFRQTRAVTSVIGFAHGESHTNGNRPGVCTIAGGGTERRSIDADVSVPQSVLQDLKTMRSQGSVGINDRPIVGLAHRKEDKLSGSLDGGCRHSGRIVSGGC